MLHVLQVLWPEKFAFDNANDLKEQPFYAFLAKTYWWHITAQFAGLWFLGGLPAVVWLGCVRVRLPSLNATFAHFEWCDFNSPCKRKDHCIYSCCVSMRLQPSGIKWIVRGISHKCAAVSRQFCLRYEQLEPAEESDLSQQLAIVMHSFDAEAIVTSSSHVQPCICPLCCSIVHDNSRSRSSSMHGLNNSCLCCRRRH